MKISKAPVRSRLLCRISALSARPARIEPTQQPRVARTDGPFHPPKQQYRNRYHTAHDLPSLLAPLRSLVPRADALPCAHRQSKALTSHSFTASPALAPASSGTFGPARLTRTSRAVRLGQERLACPTEWRALAGRGGQRFGRPVPLTACEG